MTDFDALLKRSFAEAAEPVDDGFTVKIEQAVTRRENALKLRNLAQTIGLAAAGVALVYGGVTVYGAFGQEAVATAGLEVARVHGALSSSTPTFGVAVQSVLQTLGTGMSQMMLMTAAVLAGGAVVYRTTQE